MDYALDSRDKKSLISPSMVRENKELEEFCICPICQIPMKLTIANYFRDAGIKNHDENTCKRKYDIRDILSNPKSGATIIVKEHLYTSGGVFTGNGGRKPKDRTNRLSLSDFFENIPPLMKSLKSIIKSSNFEVIDSEVLFGKIPISKYFLDLNEINPSEYHETEDREIIRIFYGYANVTVIDPIKNYAIIKFWTKDPNITVTCYYNIHFNEKIFHHLKSYHADRQKFGVFIRSTLKKKEDRHNTYNMEILDKNIKIVK